jgi:6-pyruvoyltetrahydropterin/6-carboxytetrahydropterin synthase
LERWSIKLEKEGFKFSAAHFLIFPDGSAERLHGHNYRVYIDLDAALSLHGLVIDFKTVKPVVRQVVDELDEHWLVPGEHPVLHVTRRGDGITEVRYRERYYAAPDADVIVLPLNNLSAENLATWVGRQLLRRLGARFPELVVRELTCGVEETAGQRGIWHWTADDPRAASAPGPAS